MGADLYPVPVAFDLSSNTPIQREIIESAIARCDFDFARILPRLRAEKGRDAVPVTWEDLTRFGEVQAHVEVPAVPLRAPGEDARAHDGHGDTRRATLGLAYYSGRIVIERSLEFNRQLAAEVFLCEAAHMVDFFVLTPEQRARIYELFHEPGAPAHDHGWFEETGNNDYWSWVGEAWMYGFIHAFTPDRPDPGRFGHRFTEADIREVRELLGTRAPTPPDPGPEVGPPVYATRWGRAFHREGAHWWIPTTRQFMDRDVAIERGLRPCRWCNP